MTDNTLENQANDSVETALEILRNSHSIIEVTVLRKRLQNYVTLLEEWSDALSLLSSRDRFGIPAHIVDSLSLIPYIEEFEALTDIGSGGGFPAVPIAAALPGTFVTMIERSSKKAGFLRKAIARLGLTRARVVHASFSSASASISRQAVTARAMEAPEAFYPTLHQWLPVGARLLYQGAEDPAIYFPPEWLVGEVHDIWTDQGLRRGRLVLVEPKPS